MANLFSELEQQNKQVPLAELLRPKTLEEFLGQSNVIAKNSPLMNCKILLILKIILSIVYLEGKYINYLYYKNYSF